MNEEEKKLLIANWKMNGDLDLVATYNKNLPSQILEGWEIIICPPLPFITMLANNISKGAQDVSEIESYGAHTGQVNASMLKNLGVNYALVGHCETRKANKNQDIAQKIKNCVKAGITPVLCIGETEEEKNKFLTTKVLERQILEAEIAELENIAVAYEPIWAIENRQIITTENLETITNSIEKIFITNKIKTRKILYGGAVDGSNVKNILLCDKIKGLLVGSASLHYHKFVEIINNI
jgi:triosephosphate isomerase